MSVLKEILTKKMLMNKAPKPRDANYAKQLFT
jgi:hypothetical protein